MDLNEVKQFIEENKDNEEVKNYIGGLITPDRVEGYLNNDDGKKLLQPKLDSFFTKGLESWKGNNLQKLIDDAIAKSNPSETPEQKQIRELTERLNRKEGDEKRQVLLNKALLKADEKKLPKDVLEFFLGDDEESTVKNLDKLESVFSKHVETLVQERLKGSSYVPPKGGEGKSFTIEEIEKMSQEEINKNWDVISKVLSGK